MGTASKLMSICFQQKGPSMMRGILCTSEQVCPVWLQQIFNLLHCGGRERTSTRKHLDQHRQCCYIRTPGWHSAIVQGRDLWSPRIRMHEGWPQPRTKRRTGRSTKQWSWGCSLHILRLPLPVLHCAPEHIAQTMPAGFKPQISDPICIKTACLANSRLFFPILSQPAALRG